MTATIPPLGDAVGRKTFPARTLRERPQALCEDEAVAEDTWLRDRLALDRTSLANERTLLAYVRTALGLVAAAAAAIHFLGSPWVDAVSWGLVAAGIFVLAYGLVRFGIVGRQIKKASRRLPPANAGGDPSAPLGD